MRTKKLISAVAPLRPIQIIDLATGEEVSFQDHNAQVIKLVEFVQQEVINYYKSNAQCLEASLASDQRGLQPAEWARQNGYSLDMSGLSKSVKTKSRIERLYRHKLVSEVSSFVNNPNPRKQAPSFGPKVNLGAVDTQMASLSIEGSVLTLRFKVWEKEYLIDFRVPDYVLKRSILKWSLPTIEVRKGEPFYIFSIEESPAVRENRKNFAGLDLGRVEPFTMVVINKNGSRIADYRSSGRVRELNAKRERILKEKSFIFKKINQYDKLGLDSSVLRTEARFKSGKALILGDEVANRVGADVARKLAKHDVSVLAVEDLRWVHGARYGSKWVHSKVQSKLEHSALRIGVKTKKVNPRNTSQLCYLCNSVVVHNSKSRVAKCSDCKESFDRDFNAAMNIARKLKCYPTRERRSGNKYSPTGQLIEDTNPHNSDLKKPLTRMVT